MKLSSQISSGNAISYCALVIDEQEYIKTRRPESLKKPLKKRKGKRGSYEPFLYFKVLSQIFVFENYNSVPYGLFSL